MTRTRRNLWLSLCYSLVIGSGGAAVIGTEPAHRLFGVIGVVVWLSEAHNVERNEERATK